MHIYDYYNLNGNNNNDNYDGNSCDNDKIDVLLHKFYNKINMLS